MSLSWLSLAGRRPRVGHDTVSAKSGGIDRVSLAERLPKETTICPPLVAAKRAAEPVGCKIGIIYP